MNDNKTKLLDDLIEKCKTIPLAGSFYEKINDIESLLDKELEPLLVPEVIEKRELDIVKASKLDINLKRFYLDVPKGIANKYLSKLKQLGRSPFLYLRIRSNKLIANEDDENVFDILALTFKLLTKRYVNEILPSGLYIDTLHSEEYISHILGANILAMRAFPVKYTGDEYAILCQLLVEKKDRGGRKIHAPNIKTPVYA